MDILSSDAPHQEDDGLWFGPLDRSSFGLEPWCVPRPARRLPAQSLRGRRHGTRGDLIDVSSFLHRTAAGLSRIEPRLIRPMSRSDRPLRVQRYSWGSGSTWRLNRSAATVRYTTNPTATVEYQGIHQVSPKRRPEATDTPQVPPAAAAHIDLPYRGKGARASAGRAGRRDREGDPRPGHPQPVQGVDLIGMNGGGR